MRAWVHALCIVAGIAAPVGLTLLTTRSGGLRSAQHYAQVRDGARTPREVMAAFEHMAFDQHRPVEAIETFFDPGFKDHDPGVKGDRQSAIDRMKQLNWQTGGPKRTIVHFMTDGDLVAIHHRLVRSPGAQPIAAVDIFRVADGKIIEHWDVLQPVPLAGPNPAPMF